MVPKQTASETVAAGDVTLGTAVVRAVSETDHRAPEALPPLTEAIDPDALDAAFRGRRGDGTVRFRYAGHVVTVHADRRVELSPA